MNRFISPFALWYAVTTRRSGTSTNPASGAMIGIATVASPDDDGIRNDSGRNSTYMTIGEGRLADITERHLGPVQHRVRDLPVVHDHGDAAGDADDQCHAEEVPRAVDERLGQLALAHPADQPDHDREQQERRRHLREPPPQRREPDPEVLPRDDAVHHHEEREAEHARGSPSAAGHAERRLVLVSRALKCASLSAFMSYTSERRRVRLHPVRVPHHEEDPDRQPDDQDHQPCRSGRR